ncbi:MULTISPECIES: DinB family protein [Paenibacillus]|uniref:DinB family protein n=1 Tax=Paenibacillus TaxID=44249 RepID=UPI00096D11C0|nr:DinB family protein [Paenibacillus odorifer]OMD06935.1 squalene--hopene cyclase [Paenibacillus odorifer]OMD09425.1 squalene--hopene cyclase [Paenibacillus odorifer]OMD32415.1 squalene--hopene cyclase [Paenibacillus odorifer]OZQ76357.1 squalene--hopene cyclase [Paenibacillus odorifer]
MGRRPESSEYLEELSKYVDLVPAEGDIITIFREQTDEICTFISNLTEEQGDYRYAPEKWSIKEMVGHLADTGRIMSYRLLCIARGDTTPLPGFEEKDYVLNANFEAHTLKALLAHYKLVRESTLLLMETLPEEAWIRKGIVNEATLSARAQACIMIGHDHHHLNILKDRYLG